VGNGIAVIVERQRSGTQGGSAILSVSIIQRGLSYPHDHIGSSAAGVDGVDYAAMGTDDHGGILIVDGIADEVWGGIEFPQVSLRSMQFLLHRRDQNIVFSRLRWRSAVQRRFQKNCEYKDQSAIAKELLHLVVIESNAPALRL
jgi:hypothetical protein